MTDGARNLLTALAPTIGPGGRELNELEPAHIEVEEETETYVRIVAEPLAAGFGTTLGNALRRVLLSSLPGAAVTSVRIEEVEHEFSTIPHMKEDTTEFLLNIKEIRLRALADRPAKLYLEASGEGPVTAGSIQTTADYEVVNPELPLATLDAPEGRLTVELNVEPGQGYAPAGHTDGLPIGVIPVDAIFSPVRRVNFHVAHTRVGQMTNYDRLTLEVWTDGTIPGIDAISKSSDILIDELRMFAQLGKPLPPTVERGLGVGTSLPPDKYNMPIEDLNLSVRAYNCLKRSGLMTVGAVLEKSEDELLSLRNFGRKSYDELRDKLAEMGLLPPPEERGDDYDGGLPIGRAPSGTEEGGETAEDL
ncbi:MAG: DNA-directed RNA polymerase subunit alpha, partial [Chloroflexi bacterium]|nr:DNA-directed RNA polymerase subunit alpha [Chloroflexota bacterium]